MSIVANFDVNFRGDTKGIDKAVDSAGKKVSNLSDAVEKIGKDAKVSPIKAETFTPFANILPTIEQGVAKAKGLILGFSATLLSAAFSMAKLQEVSTKLGTTTDVLAGLQFAGNKVGVAIEDVNASLLTLRLNLNLAGQGSGPALLALAQLNLYGKDLARLPLGQQLETIAAAIAKVGNSADRLRLARDLGIEALLPLLTRGREGIQALRQEAKDLNLGDPATAQAAQDAVRAWGELKMQGSAFVSSVLVAGLPLIERFTSLLREGGANGTNYFRDIAAGVTEVVNTLDLLIGKLAILDIARQAQTGGWESLFESWLRGIFAAQYAIENFGEVWNLVYDFARAKVVALGNEIAHFFTNVLPALLSGVATAIGNALIGDFSGAADALKNSLAGVPERLVTDLEGGLNTSVERRFNAFLTGVEQRMQAFRRRNAPRDRGPNGANGLAEKPEGEPMEGIPMKTAAMEIGSKEAFSTMYGTMDQQAKALDVANEQLAENKAMRVALEKILKGLGAGPILRQANV